MTVVETLLVFLVAPLAVVLLAYALVMLPTLKSRKRYKPGEPWGHGAVWYEPHRPGGGGHGAGHGADHDEHPALGKQAAALAIGETAGHPRRTAAGGARGTW
ncbi:aa3-type cytochrome oxidase subunit CtaJ [Klenkia taihuensis]|uniref:Uncharacterized protein n=1 Tax=Klenkia taihuensis TaxID=1225127 RepID=A0A1I1S8L7_9ACTN|nr:hypothetical protein [Klenkia taihuensis]GHE13606.1 hypothetical protein GCM10011381_36640 [Klenkia taihuensis]SFD42747.1 hypothetical protein SAMN05661030_3302 [Klenkia taihuensis]